MLVIGIFITLGVFITAYWIYRIRTTDGDLRYKKLYDFIQFFSFNSILILPLVAALVYFDDVPGGKFTELLGLDPDLINDNFLVGCILVLHGYFALITFRFISRKLFIFFTQGQIGRVRVEQIIRRPNIWK